MTSFGCSLISATLYSCKAAVNPPWGLLNKKSTEIQNCFKAAVNHTDTQTQQKALPHDALRTVDGEKTKQTAATSNYQLVVCPIYLCSYTGTRIYLFLIRVFFPFSPPFLRLTIFNPHLSERSVVTGLFPPFPFRFLPSFFKPKRVRYSR